MDVSFDGLSGRNITVPSGKTLISTEKVSFFSGHVLDGTADGTGTRGSMRGRKNGRRNAGRMRLSCSTGSAGSGSGGGGCSSRTLDLKLIGWESEPPSRAYDKDVAEGPQRTCERRSGDPARTKERGKTWQ